MINYEWQKYQSFIIKFYNNAEQQYLLRQFITSML